MRITCIIKPDKEYENLKESITKVVVYLLFQDTEQVAHYRETAQALHKWHYNNLQIKLTIETEHKTLKYLWQTRRKTQTEAMFISGYDCQVDYITGIHVNISCLEYQDWLKTWVLK